MFLFQMLEKTGAKKHKKESKCTSFQHDENVKENFICPIFALGFL